MRKVVIVGGGTAGWMCAAALARFSPPNTHISLVESDEIGTIGVGEATIPLLTEFNQFLGIDEHEMLSECAGTYKLGIEFIDWFKKGEGYFHPFGFFGKDTPEFPFHQLWLKLNSLQRGAVTNTATTDICDFNLCTAAARLGRFAQPQGNANTILSTMRHAYHFDAAAYGKLLRRYAEQRKVQRIEGRVVDVRMESPHQNIQSLVLKDGQAIKGDLFIDCSGFKALLIEGKMKSQFKDWSHFLPCDRAIAVQSANTSDPLPYTRAFAKHAGWQWQIPLQNRMGNGYVYCSHYLEQHRAVDALLQNIQGATLTPPKVLQFRTGHRRTFWEKNCVAIGLAGGFIEPLESTSIHLVQQGIQLLVNLWPLEGSTANQMAQYNRMMTAEYEDIRDFIVLHYKATTRNDSAFWNYVREMAIPNSLQEKIDEFKASGKITTCPGALFTTHSWLAVMLGQGVIPKQYDKRVDRIEESTLVHHLLGLRESVRRTAESMPTHQQYINTHCAASASIPL